MTTIRPRRSFIFAPGNKPDMFPKAMATGADIMCIDLEDAIAPQHKEQARAATLDWFATAELDDSVECMVRINPPRTPDGMKDVQAILDSAKAPPSLMLAKVKSPAEVIALDELFDEFKIASRLQVIIETNEALEAAWEIARCSTRIDAIFFGGVDMAADLRCEYTWEALLYARSRVVHAAAGAGVDVIDVPFLDLNDMEGMKREAQAARALGFCGKGSIHPKQVPVLNEIFSPSEAEIAHAKRIVEAFEQGDSGLVVIDGKLIEKPVLRSMYRVLARAGL
ncbi:CoA ester lyase [Thalassobaculum sp. OXR-137]|uniref:HpcH/HpaI aldolase/citrate lyase family protein n=1 Tax=Thalassobaculum sp. OXR-137 TaxID=3100173 RepID=UPI002AC8D1FE|nr:CoA ester lyase [Thalassobaculum sp. OXR-137]WPZ34248.1 CoA ester lyase [Thalassobaculum sp. OXR-137]